MPPPTADVEFRRLLAAEGVSNFGAMLSRLAIPWLAALVLDATPLQMASLLVADVAAAAVSSLWVGAWVERHGKRRAMLLCDFARAGVLAALAWAAWQGQATMPLLALAAAANGVLTMAFEVARSAWMAQRLPEAHLVNHNAQMSAVTSLSETAAFAAGGWVFQWLGAALALAVDALSYIVSALCVRGTREVPAAGALAAGPRSDETGFRATARGLWREVADGLAAIRARPALRAVAVLEGLVALAGSLTGTSYMIYVSRDLAIPTGTLGFVFAAGGIGALVGARLAAATPRLRVGWAMTLGLTALALGAACIPLATGAGMLALGLLVAHQVVGDGGHTLFEVHDRTLRQTQAGPELLARVDAGIRCVGQCATLAGALAGGLLGTLVDARSVLVLAVAVLAVAALFAAIRLRRLGPGHEAPQAPPAAAG